MGATFATGAVIAGAGLGITGGLGGAFMNMREGGSEIYDRARSASTSSSTAVPPALGSKGIPVSLGKPEKYLIKDGSMGGSSGKMAKQTSVEQQRNAQIGKEIWNAAV